MAASQSRRILVISGLTAVYFVAGRFGLSLAFINESASAVWPPTGIAIAALLLIGTYTWPALLYVFDEFRQADESMTRSHGGLGLGLAIARRIVQRHGGTITCSNRPDGGALFTVRLPVNGPARVNG